MNIPHLRVLWSFARPHKGALVVGLVLALLGSAAGLATPMVTKWVLDSLGTSASLAGPVLTLLALFVAGAVIWLTQWILLGTVGERVVLRARETMVRRFFRATVPEVSKRPTGELVTRVTSDTVLLREAASSSVIGLINGVVLLVGTLVLMSVLDAVLLLTTVAAVIVVIIMFALLMPGIAKEQTKSQERVGALGGVLEGALRAIRTVKASRAEERQTERIMVDARASTRHSIRAVRREALAWTVSWSGIQLAIIVILGVGAWRVGEGLLEVSSLIAFLLYAFALMEPIMELSQNMTALQSGIAAARRIREVDAIEVETDAPGTGSPSGSGSWAGGGSPSGSGSMAGSGSPAGAGSPSGSGSAAGSGVSAGAGSSAGSGSPAGAGSLVGGDGPAAGSGASAGAEPSAGIGSPPGAGAPAGSAGVAGSGTDGSESLAGSGVSAGAGALAGGGALAGNGSPVGSGSAAGSGMPGGSGGGPILELRGVTAGYGGEPAVRDVSLVVPRRGHVAIVGPSGAGKTTLFSLVMRFLEPSGGTLLLDGRPYGEQTYAAVRSRLAYVEQETPVVPGTIRDNLLFTHPDATEEELRRALGQVRLADKIDALPEGLDTSLTSSSVSGGQRQRIALARAILRTPEVLLLDEATAQVDSLTEAAIHDCIRRRAADGAVVTVAHRLSTVIDADTIVVMDEGRVHAQGTHENLLTTSRLYRDLVEALRISTEPAPL